MAVLIRALNLNKSFSAGTGTVYALNDVSLEIYPGEMVAILGRDGSGKSSLLHAMGCQQKPDSGELHLEGEDVYALDDKELTNIRLRRIGFLFQAFNLLPNETATANVELPLLQMGVGKWDCRNMAGEALKMVGLENRAANRLAQLPASQRQCVAIARAMVNNPEVIFADEPTKNLDSTGSEEVLGILQRLNDTGTAIVIATSESGVATHCRRLVRMAEGKIVQDGLVAKRRVIPESRIPGTLPEVEDESQKTEDGWVCPRCNHGNAKESELCSRCNFFALSEEEQKSIESRLSGADPRALGVESDNDDGEVQGQEMIEELKGVPFFTGLGSKALVRIMSALVGQHYQKGSSIVKQGEPADAFYIIKSGKVNVLLDIKGKASLPIAKLGPQEGFGEMALLTDSPRTASVVAATEVDVWRLTRKGFDVLLEENLSLGLYFSRIVTERLKALQEKIIP